MEYRNLGKTGLKVSALCMGTMQFGWSVGEAETQRILSQSFETGINFIDSADIYSKWVEDNPGGVAEEYIGRWRKQAKIPRDRLVIATKVRGKMGKAPNDEGLSRVHIMRAVEASLRRLDTDYIDLYQTHWPDKDTPIEETLLALDDLVRQGKVRYIGASNYKAWELMQALWASDVNGLVHYDSLQPHYNLIRREEFERELKAVCETYGIGVIPYSPLEGGFLTGKYRRDTPLPDSRRAEGRQKYMTERNFAILDLLDEIAASHQATVTQVSLAWLLADSLISSPIIGVTSFEQLDENLGALDVKLTEGEKQRIDDLTTWED
ncbi:MAG: aldo/keto reductase [Anaerolineales bacterium]|jgi:aryl-alcohol dehydrogenase-like predicted oxidoreductase